MRDRVADPPQRRRPGAIRRRLRVRHVERHQTGAQQVGEIAAADRTRSPPAIPRAKTSRPSCDRRSSQSAAWRIRARASNWRRRASASASAAREAAASAGSNRRDHNSVSVAAITVQPAQRSSCRVSRPASAAASASANCAIRAPIDSLARLIFFARAISSSQSSGPAKPSTDSTGAVSVRATRGGSSQSDLRIGEADLGRRRRGGVTEPRSWVQIKAQRRQARGDLRQRAPGRPVGRPEGQPKPRLAAVGWRRAVLAGRGLRRDMAQFPRGAPVLPEPGERSRIVGPAPQDLARHRHQGVQIERAGPAVADPGDRQIVPARHGVAQLARRRTRAPARLRLRAAAAAAARPAGGSSLPRCDRGRDARG